MSECVVRIEMPKDCQYCAMAHWDLRNILSGCDAAPGKRYLQGKDDEFWKDGRPSWCPIICQLPEGHGRLVDADAMAKDLEYDCELNARGLDDMTIVGHEREHLQFDKDCKQNCMRYLTEQETIVPAEAERSET